MFYLSVFNICLNEFTQWCTWKSSFDTWTSSTSWLWFTNTLYRLYAQLDPPPLPPLEILGVVYNMKDAVIYVHLFKNFYSEKKKFWFEILRVLNISRILIQGKQLLSVNVLVNFVRWRKNQTFKSLTTT